MQSLSWEAQPPGCCSVRLASNIGGVAIAKRWASFERLCEPRGAAHCARGGRAPHFLLHRSGLGMVETPGCFQMFLRNNPRAQSKPVFYPHVEILTHPTHFNHIPTDED
jgi:hypothetical protein